MNFVMPAAVVPDAVCAKADTMWFLALAIKMQTFCLWVKALVLHIVGLADFHHQHTVGFHRTYHLIREAAGCIGIGAGLALHTGACAQGQHTGIFGAELGIHLQEVLLVGSLGIHHSLDVHIVFQFTYGLDQNALGIARHPGGVFLQRAAAGRTAPALVVLSAGVCLAHLADFRLHVDGLGIQRANIGESDLLGQSFQLFKIHYSSSSNSRQST